MAKILNDFCIYIFSLYSAVYLLRCPQFLLVNCNQVGNQYAALAIATTTRCLMNKSCSRRNRAKFSMALRRKWLVESLLWRRCDIQFIRFFFFLFLCFRVLFAHKSSVVLCTERWGRYVSIGFYCLIFNLQTANFAIIIFCREQDESIAPAYDV